MEMDPKIFELIAILAEKLGTTVTELIPKYVRWASINAIAFCLWGVAFIYFGFDGKKRLTKFGENKEYKNISKDEWDKEDWVCLGTVIKYVCIFIGIFIIVKNFANIFSPTPAAIKKLIKNVKGM